MGAAAARRLRRPAQAPPPAPQADHVGRVLPALADHASRYAGPLGAADLTSFEARVFSENGEDGVIAEILRRVGVGSRFFVEFGIGDGRQGNCVLLADVYGWSGLFCEVDDAAHRGLADKYSHSERVRTVRVAVSPQNVETVFRSNGVPEDLDVLSIDIDGNDYWVWESIISFKPRLVVIEYNASLSVERALVFPYDEHWRWDGTAFYGSSLGGLRRLGEQKGYRLVHTDLCGVNAFFVREDLAESVGVENPPLRAANFRLTGQPMAPDPHGRKWLDLDSD